MDDITRKLLSTTDAMVWTSEFLAQFPVNIDEGTMISWFANAIETGRDAGHVTCRDQEAQLAEIREIHLEPAAVVGLAQSLVAFEDTRRVLGIQHLQDPTARASEERTDG